MTDRFAIACAVAAGLLFASGGARAQGEANLFLSPPGEPFTAPASAPYPIVNWFKRADANGDGKLDIDEFRADAEAFFKVLDRDHNGVLTSDEIYIYEHQIAPEILNEHQAALQTGLIRVDLQSADGLDLPSVTVDPGGDKLDEQDARPPVFMAGAAYYGLFNEPEPVMSADRNFDFRVTLKEFLARSDQHFQALDVNNKGFLTLADLPQTAAEKAAHGRRAPR